MGGFVQNSRAASFFSRSISYVQDDLTWCVRRADILPAYLNIFRLADFSVLLSYGALIASAGILLFVYSKTDPYIIHSNKNIYYMLLLTAVPASGGFTVSRRILPHRPLFRIFFFCNDFGELCGFSYIQLFLVCNSVAYIPPCASGRC